MTRFERDGHSFEVWIERDLVETWRDFLWTRRDDDAPERGETSYAGRRRYAELVGEHLRDGWQRIDDAPSAEPRNPELDERMLEDREAAAPIYADWLQQRGHPRGALIAIQLARANRPDDAELRAEEERLVVEVLDWLAESRVVHDGTANGAGLELRWSHGFLEAARIDGFHDDGESEDLLWWLFEDPSARFLRELVIGCHHPGDQDNQLMTTVLMKFPHPPPLRRLYLADFDDTRDNNIDISRAWLGDLSGLGKRYPLLEDVTLKGHFNTTAGQSFLDDLDLPRARRFAMRTSALRRETLAAILAARWPALAELELWFGDDEYGGDCRVADLAPLLLRADGFPALRTLRIMNAPLVADDFVARLADSPRLPALEVLEFSLGGLSDDGARAIVAARDRFRHLRAIRIFDCGVTTSALDALRGAGLVIEAPEQGAARSIRYASVTE